ncbi:MAG: DUF1800 domain-containing protein, partial [Pseudomonadota bacterium]
MSVNAAIACTRFGYGAAPGDIRRVARVGARNWLTKQLSPEQVTLPRHPILQPAKKRLLETIGPYGRRGFDDQSKDEKRNYFNQSIAILSQESRVRTKHGSNTGAPFAERLVRFWANHFTVSARTAELQVTVGAFEREAIRPHIFGSFTKLLEAATFHHAMLIYLDNAMSVGPNSSQGRSGRRGLNENHARELLELHTVGEAAGFTQIDVQETAKILSGWTIGTRHRYEPWLGNVIFGEAMHEPGRHVVLNTLFGSNGRRQASQLLDSLALHPATARRIATKLAEHFVADDPPTSLVDRLETAYLRSRGQLKSLYMTLINSPEAWEPRKQKIKTPEDLVLSTARSLGTDAVLRSSANALASMGQASFEAPSPRGWPDHGDFWMSPDAMIKRIDWMSEVVSNAGPLDPDKVLAETLGPLASPE